MSLINTYQTNLFMIHMQLVLQYESQQKKKYMTALIMKQTKMNLLIFATKGHETKWNLLREKGK